MSISDDTLSQDPDAALAQLFSDEVSAERLMELAQEMDAIPADNASLGLKAMSDDGGNASKPVGRLKLIARYNDSMQFYDGHVYMLFTSYQDGVTFAVNDLYGGYAISDQYYVDINENILNGSHRTGTDAGAYFSFDDDMKSVTLDRGEIVTIGMYRGFDLSVQQAALGVIQNSTLWNQLTSETKTAIVKTLFQALNNDTITMKESFASIKAVLEAEGLDYRSLFDGVVKGGVCLNRELYNQKLEWNQYPNVTYEVDVTQEQLSTLAMYLTGNLNKFNILKNSCATVALRAWNAAVAGNDENNENYVSPTSAGIFSVADAPGGVRNNMRSKFEGRDGYYANDSTGGDPEAGAQLDDEWVYVSAPKPVTPVEYTYEDKSIQVDTTRTKMSTLVTAAKGDAQPFYNKDAQAIPVVVNRTTQANATTITNIDFDINGSTVSLDANSTLGEGMWLKVQIANPQAGEFYYVTDAEDNVLPSKYADGWICFYADSLPVSYLVNARSNGTRNILQTTIANADEAKVTTDIYYKDGNDTISIASTGEVASGTKVYVRTTFDQSEIGHILSDVKLNGASIKDAEHWDDAENAYAFVMPESYTTLEVIYDEAVINMLKGHNGIVQVSVGDTLSIDDYAELLVGEKAYKSDRISWKILGNVGVDLAYADADHRQLVVNAIHTFHTGVATILACADDNSFVKVLFLIMAYENLNDMVKVTYPEDSVSVLEMVDGGDPIELLYSGIRVDKGAKLTVRPNQKDGTVVSDVTANCKHIAPGETITADQDVDIQVSFKEAQVTGMPSKIAFGSTGESYQLEAEVHYVGLIDQFLPVYDSSIRYESSSDLVSVDETGKVTVVGEVPAEGKTVIITAYAGSSNDAVSAQTKVILGDYHGEDIVGRLTINARRIHKGEFIPHGAITFTTYDDIDLNVSHYEWYKPTEQYTKLMEDYRDNPTNYDSDPALCNGDALGLGGSSERELYFEQRYNGAESEAETVSLRCGESISLSSYSFDKNNLTTLMGTIEDSTLSNDPTVQL